MLFANAEMENLHYFSYINPAAMIDIHPENYTK